MACKPQETVGIVAALALEAALLTKQIKELGLEAHVLVATKGPGPERAGDAARDLQDRGAKRLMSFGVAGGLDPAYPPGTLILASQVTNARANLLPTDQIWRNKLASACGQNLPLITAALTQSAGPVTSLKAKARLFADTHAAAVDMESYAIADLARQTDTPFLAVRAITDGARDAIPATAQAALMPDGTLDIGALLKSLMHHPGDIAALIKLAKNQRAATRALSDFARLALPVIGI